MEAYTNFNITPWKQFNQTNPKNRLKNSCWPYISWLLMIFTLSIFLDFASCWHWIIMRLLAVSNPLHQVWLPRHPSPQVHRIQWRRLSQPKLPLQALLHRDSSSNKKGSRRRVFFFMHLLGSHHLHRYFNNWDLSCHHIPRAQSLHAFIQSNIISAFFQCRFPVIQEPYPGWCTRRLVLRKHCCWIPRNLTSGCQNLCREKKRDRLWAFRGYIHSYHLTVPVILGRATEAYNE